MKREPEKGLLTSPLPALNDLEGQSVPPGLPAVIDAHVHLFPGPLFRSIWEWFGRYGWPVRYQMDTPELVTFLLSRGITHLVALHYAHKPGMAGELNTFLADFCASQPRVTGLATVFPGEEGAGRILREAFDLGLAGVKLHAHVQCFDMLSPAMEEIYRVCEERNKPMVMHVGREPKSPASPCDAHELCSAGRLELVLRAHPGLRVCVPHLGLDEFEAYQRMIEVYDNLWLDTTMALADYLPGCRPPPLAAMRADRIMYGSDFPNIPYAWDRELKRFLGLGLREEALALILGRNAARFFSIPGPRDLGVSRGPGPNDWPS